MGCFNDNNGLRGVLGVRRFGLEPDQVSQRTFIIYIHHCLFAAGNASVKRLIVEKVTLKLRS